MISFLKLYLRLEKMRLFLIAAPVIPLIHLNYLVKPADSEY